MHRACWWLWPLKKYAIPTWAFLSMPRRGGGEGQPPFPQIPCRPACSEVCVCAGGCVPIHVCVASLSIFEGLNIPERRSSGQGQLCQNPPPQLSPLTSSGE